MCRVTIILVSLFQYMNIILSWLQKKETDQKVDLFCYVVETSDSNVIFIAYLPSQDAGSWCGCLKSQADWWFHICIWDRDRYIWLNKLSLKTPSRDCMHETNFFLTPIFRPLHFDPFTSWIFFLGNCNSSFFFSFSLYCSSMCTCTHDLAIK